MEAEIAERVGRGRSARAAMFSICLRFYLIISIHLPSSCTERRSAKLHFPFYS